MKRVVVGRFKGWRPRGENVLSIVVTLAFAEALGFIGYLQGLFGRDDLGKLVLLPDTWDMERITYTAIMWISYGVIMWVSLKSDEDSNVKFGIGVLVSLPVGGFVVFFFDLIELAPK